MPEPLAADEVWTFRVQRGSFTIPGALFEDGRELDLARHYATHMPDDRAARGQWDKPDAAGNVVVHWRIIRRVQLS